MSEEEAPSNPKYIDGDIVWVKLGSSWWPGEVTENGPDDLNPKKPPLVIVKFFNETTFEFVKNYNQIYPYNCERKNDFIRKGMDLFRGNNAHMEKFPIDVSLAEVRTEGNPNILSDPMFLPRKKTPKASGRARGASKLNITHRRFLGFDDYEAYIRPQYPGKDMVQMEGEDAVRVQADETASTFPCSLCPFQTDRLEVMVFHVQRHVMPPISPKKKKTSPKKPRSPRKPKLSQKHITSEDDAANSSIFDTDSDGEVKRKPKRKRKSTGTPKTIQSKVKKTETVDESKGDYRTEIRTNLLAEWSDSGEESEAEKTKTNNDFDNSTLKEASNVKESNETNGKDESKSCFDFEDEEEDNSMVHTAVGRKIPRVIPPNDKRKSSDPDDKDASLPIAEDDENRMEILKVNETVNADAPSVEEASEPETPKEIDDSVFNKLMESTVADVDLPELPGAICGSKSVENSTAKKSDNSTEVVATKLTNPKKRFVKSFEDFELLQNEARKAQEEKERLEEPKEDCTTISTNLDDDDDKTKELPMEEDTSIDTDYEKKCLNETLKFDELIAVKETIDEISKTENLDKLEDTIETCKEEKQPKKDTLEKNEHMKNKELKIKENLKQKERLKQQNKEVYSKSDDKKSDSEKSSQSDRKLKEKIEKEEPEKKKKQEDVKLTERRMSQDEKSKEKIKSRKKSTHKKHGKQEETVLKKIEVDTKRIEDIITEFETTPSTVKEMKASIPEPELNEETNKIEDESPEKATTIPKKDSDTFLISKLKTQIMSKITDDEIPTTSKTIARRQSQRTPKHTISDDFVMDKIGLRSPKSKSQKNEPETAKNLKISKLVVEDEVDEKIEPEPLVSEPPVKESAKKTKPNSIDDYFNNILFDISDKSSEINNEAVNVDEKIDSIEIENKQEETVPVQEKSEENPHKVTVKCDNDNKNDVDLQIETNLTNLNKTDDEMSALTTLAMVSESFEPKPQSIEEMPIIEDDALITTEEVALEEHFANQPESELVSIDATPTVVSEKELTDAQVEITADISLNNKKPVTLTTFSMDFSESNSNSSSAIEKAPIINEEIVPNEIVPQEEVVQKVDEKIGGDKKLASLMADLEDEIPQQIIIDKTKPVITEKVTLSPSTSSKLLERLTTTNETPKSVQIKTVKAAPATYKAKEISKSVAPMGTKTKFVIKSAMIKGGSSSSSKPVILSEKIFKPEAATNVSVQKVTSKRILQDADDIEDIDAFIIRKDAKKIDESIAEPVESGVGGHYKRYKKTIETKPKQIGLGGSALKKRGKAKILQQTIITPAGEIIQPAGTTQNISISKSEADDSNVFDINSMPIVLSDQILTPESIENMPIYLSDAGSEKIAMATTPSTPKVQVQTHQIVKKVVQQQHPQQMRVLNKSMGETSLGLASGNEKIGRIVKTPRILGNMGPQTRIVKHNSFTTGKQGKYVIVTQPQASSTPTSKYTVGKRQNYGKRPTVVGDTSIGSSSSVAKVQNVLAQEPVGNKIMIVTNQQGQKHRVLLTPAQQKMMGYQTQGSKLKTIMKGETPEKKEIQLGTIAGSSGAAIPTRPRPKPQQYHQQHVITSAGQIITQAQHQPAKALPQPSPAGTRKLQIQSQHVNINKKKQKTIIIKNQQGQTLRKIQGTDDALLEQQVAEQLEAIKASGVLQHKQDVIIPSTATYKTTNTTYATTPAPKTVRRSYAKKPVYDAKPKPQQTKPTEAVLPPLAPISPKKAEVAAEKGDETKGERPLNQLVIQDAMGNQTTITEGQILALPSETVDGQAQSYMLVTLDESGNLTPLNNEALMSLDPNLALGGDLSNAVLQIDQSALKEAEEEEPATAEPSNQLVEEEIPTTSAEMKIDDAPEEKIEESVEEKASVAESGQQLIVTGDPIAAQKFLESLTEGNADLANILANAEGSSILIHADGQQILINTDSDNQMLLSVNNMAENTEGDGNPIFANQPTKNQDILAAALADTDVFQQEQNGAQGKGVAALSPNSGLYPMNVGNVLETSLTLNSPIMTPLEVPSTNSKKVIADENDVLGQVPKNVDLPITITDPNISQTVAQQQMANELQSNLELAISDASIVPMNSPSFVYSLPSLDEGVDMGQKPFNSSMPLLTEDAEEGKVEAEGKVEKTASFLENDGLCTLGGEMCSSLSEPPHDMFDLSDVLSKVATTHEEVEGKIDGGEKTVERVEPSVVNEDSCEIPVQPEIVATLEEGMGEGVEKKRCGDDVEEDVDIKKCKFD